MYSLRLVNIICDAVASLPPSIWLGSGIKANVCVSGEKERTSKAESDRNSRFEKLHHSKPCAGVCFVQVRDAVHAIDPQLVALACGSYRRGKATCGDVDVLISHPDGSSHKGVFSKVLQSLHESGEFQLLSVSSQTPQVCFFN